MCVRLNRKCAKPHASSPPYTKILSRQSVAGTSPMQIRFAQSIPALPLRTEIFQSSRRDIHKHIFHASQSRQRWAGCDGGKNGKCHGMADAGLKSRAPASGRLAPIPGSSRAAHPATRPCSAARTPPSPHQMSHPRMAGASHPPPPSGAALFRERVRASARKNQRRSPPFAARRVQSPGRDRRCRWQGRARSPVSTALRLRSPAPATENRARRIEDDSRDRTVGRWTRKGCGRTWALAESRSLLPRPDQAN